MFKFGVRNDDETFDKNTEYCLSHESDLLEQITPGDCRSTRVLRVDETRSDTVLAAHD